MELDKPGRMRSALGLRLYVPQSSAEQLMPTSNPDTNSPIPELEQRLTAILDQIKASYPEGSISFSDAIRSQDMDVAIKATDELQKFRSQIIDVLTQDHRFPGKKNLAIRLGPGGWMSFYPHPADSQLILNAVRDSSAELAVKNLQNVLTSKEATGQLTLALWGVPLNEIIQLMDGVELIPWGAVPDSTQKRMISGEIFNPNRWMTSAIDFSPPSSALVARQNIAPIIFDPTSCQLDERDIKKYTHLKEIALVLTLIGPRASLPLLGWFTFDNSDFELGTTSMRSQVEILPLGRMDYPSLDVHEAPELVRAYLQLPPTTRERVRIGIERINQALRREKFGDQAVELATAFEALVGDNEKTEMTHKVKIRAVRMIGGSIAERKINAALISKAYSIRSTLVHTGHVKPNLELPIDGNRVPAQQIIDRALALCVKLAKSIIRSGNFPDWSLFDIS